MADLDGVIKALDDDLMGKTKATGPKGQSIRSMAPDTCRAVVSFYVAEIKAVGLLPNGKVKPNPQSMVRLGRYLNSLKLPPEELNFRTGETLYRDARKVAKWLCGAKEDNFPFEWLDDLLHELESRVHEQNKNESLKK